jgi:hypothetical protein
LVKIVLRDLCIIGGASIRTETTRGLVLVTGEVGVEDSTEEAGPELSFVGTLVEVLVSNGGATGATGIIGAVPLDSEAVETGLEVAATGTIGALDSEAVEAGLEAAEAAATFCGVDF